MKVFKATKRPVTIEAMCLGELTDSRDSVGDWVNSQSPGSALEGPDGGLYIVTLEGKVLASSGDYIIKGIKGEFYPCKPDIFFATYDIGAGTEVSTDGQWTGEEIQKAIASHKELPTYKAAVSAFEVVASEDAERINTLEEALRKCATSPHNRVDWKEMLNLANASQKGK